MAKENILMVILLELAVFPNVGSLLLNIFQAEDGEVDFLVGRREFEK